LSKVFISYRRGDASEATLLRRQLASELGEDSVFMDVDATAPGTSWRTSYLDWLQSCDFVIAVIGPGWIEGMGENVRLELEAALSSDHVTVIPVLVNDARMPAPSELPDALGGLADMQPLSIRGPNSVEIPTLVSAIQRATRPAPGAGSDAPSDQRAPDTEAPTRPSPSARIFVSYRRDDVPDATDRLVASLADRFGEHSVFIDVDSIEIGAEFADVIGDYIERCDVLLAVIGRGWLDATDDDGERRLDDPDDFVRLEIEAALARNVRVVPVLVHGAKVPRKTQLPETLAPMLKRSAAELPRKWFDAAVDELIQAVEKFARATTTAPAEAATSATAPGLSTRVAHHLADPLSDQNRTTRAENESAPPPPGPLATHAGSDPQEESAVYICYRREETSGTALRLRERLIELLGTEQVIAEPADPGVAETVAECQLVVVLIGPQWNNLENALGNRRIDNPADHVRIALETALQRGLQLAPVYVDGANPPRADELPHSLRPVAHSNAMTIRPTRTAEDLEAVAQRVAALIRSAAE
jgi:hypothetical protein